jgi:reactive intermediate/imine deaminase
MEKIETILTANAPAPAGHYSQATIHQGAIYVSGQLPSRLVGSSTHDQDFEEQVRQALANLLAIVEASGGTRESVVRVTAYIVDVRNWPAFNKVYAEVFETWKPARSVVPGPELHHGYLVEVDAVAVRVR